MITIAVRTFNEEANIEYCLKSLILSFEDIVIIDQESTDKTLDICAKYPVRVISAPNFSAECEQLKWIVENVPYSNLWIYFCDADEIVPKELGEEIKIAVKTADPTISAFSLRYRNFFCGRWIMHCGIYPVWVTRLFKVGKVSWERKTNTRALIDWQTKYLNGHFDHYSFRKGLEHWVAKHNKYSSAEAFEEDNAEKKMRKFDLVIDSLRRMKLRHTRRQAIKQFSSLIPCRPLLRFFYMYFLRRGFLDGYAGFHYCMLLAFYEYLITIKRREISSPPFGR